MRKLDENGDGWPSAGMSRRGQAELATRLAPAGTQGAPVSGSSSLSSSGAPAALAATQSRTSPARSARTGQPQWSAAPGPLPRLVQAVTVNGSRRWKRWPALARAATACSSPDGPRQAATSASVPAPSVSHQPSTQSGEAK